MFCENLRHCGISTGYTQQLAEKLWVCRGCKIVLTHIISFVKAVW